MLGAHKGGVVELLLQVHYSKTLTEHDIKHIERHLSMKRTIRKKIMRDLQQAFVQVTLSYAVDNAGTEFWVLV